METKIVKVLCFQTTLNYIIMETHFPSQHTVKLSAKLAPDNIFCKQTTNEQWVVHKFTS